MRLQTMKLFKNKNTWQAADELVDAAENGWDDYVLGVEALDSLEVGESAVDDDGDTWERVQ
jgi:hypothetical protein